ncbi:MAG: C25 family cysteine peptidase [bacterium]
MRLATACTCFLGVFLVIGPTLAEPVKLSRTDTASQLELQEQSRSGLLIRFESGQLLAQEVITAAGTFTELRSIGSPNRGEEGAPALPRWHRLLAVPFGATTRIEILASESRIIDLDDFSLSSPLFPVQRSVPKLEHPPDRPFAYDQAAYDVERAGQEPVRIVQLGRLRAMDLARLEIAPITYLPRTNQLEVVESLVVKVHFDTADLAGGQDLCARTHSPFFRPLYEQVLNSRGFHDDYPDLVQDLVTMVIVTPLEFEPVLQDFIRWKTARGFNVIVGVLGSPEVGTTTATIRSYLHDLFLSATPELPAPSFVLFVGDVELMPVFAEDNDPFSVNPRPTDRPYCAVDGDVVPDMYYGRFPATNGSDLLAMVDKTLTYDQHDLPDPTYLSEVVMIAGVDAGHGEVWANGQINYGATNYFNPAHGIDSNTYLYPESGGQAADIIQQVSEGVAFVNYTAHASTGGWSNPYFSKSDVNELDNLGRYCLAVGNCCSSGDFGAPECFGEAWLRTPGGGAIGYIGGAGLTFWDEDYWWAVGHIEVVTAQPTYEESGLGVYDGLFHDHGEAEDQWYITNDALVFSGNLAVMESGSILGDYYWTIYNLLGDPSLTPYMGSLAVNPVTHPESILMTEIDLTITAAPGSYVGLSQDGVLCDAGLVPGGGTLELELPGTLTPWVPLRLVATTQHHTPYLAEIVVEVPVSVQITPDVIDADSPTEVTVSVRELDGITPRVGIQVWAEGFDYATTPVATDASGTAVLTLDCPFGPSLVILGQDPGESYLQFSREVEVAAAAFSAPDLFVTTEIGFADTLAVNWPGVLHVALDEPGFTLYVSLPDGSEQTSYADSLVLTPAAAGELVATLAAPGYDTYQETFPVVPLTAGGVLVITDLGTPGVGAAREKTSALVADLEQLGQTVTVEVAGQSPSTLWPEYELLVLSCSNNPEALHDAALREALRAHVTAERPLLVEGGAVVSGLHTVDPDFCRDVLHVATWVGDLGGHVMTSAPDHHVMHQPNDVPVVLAVQDVLAADQDRVHPTADATSVAIWVDDMTATSIVAYDPTPAPRGGQIVYCAFAFEVMDPVQRRQLLENCVLWLTTDDDPQSAAVGPMVASWDDSGISLTWRYDPELVTGFHVYRQLGAGNETRLTTAPVADHSGRIRYHDPVSDVSAGSVLVYQYGVLRDGAEQGRGSKVSVRFGAEFPTRLRLHPNAPNPFNPRTSIAFDLPRAGQVKLRIYDLGGRLVRTVLDEPLPAARHLVVWDGSDDQNHPVASGIYTYRLETTSGIQSRKMLLVR